MKPKERTAAGGRRSSAGLIFVLLHAAAVLNLAVFSLVLWLLRPFWSPIDDSLAALLGRSLPWTSMVFAFAAVLSCLLAALLRRYAGALVAGERRLTIFVLAPAAAVVALIGDVLLFKLFEELEKDSLLLPLRALEFGPHLLIFAGLALLMLILPDLACWKSRRVRGAALGILTGLLIIALSRPWPPRIVAGPWLEFSGNGGITVSWMTDRPTLGWVEYGPGLCQRAQSFQSGLNDADRRVHRVSLTDLPAGTRIPYRVVSRDVRAIEPMGVRLGTTTASAQHALGIPGNDSEEVSFVLFSDLHESFHLLPDLLNSVDLTHCDFVVFNGDTLFQVHNEYQVRRFLKTVSRQFAADLPFIFVRGNHDATGAFARRLPDYIGFAGSPFMGCLRVGPVALLVLDTGSDQYRVDAETPAMMDFPGWLEEQKRTLNPLLLSNEWTEAPFRVLSCHIPVEAGDPNWQPLMTEGGLDLELAAHIHTTRLTPGNGRPAVLTASGESWFNPGSYPAYLVTATRRKIVVEKLLPGGKREGLCEIAPAK